MLNKRAPGPEGIIKLNMVFIIIMLLCTIQNFFPIWISLSKNIALKKCSCSYFAVANQLRGHVFPLSAATAKACTQTEVCMHPSYSWFKVCFSYSPNNFLNNEFNFRMVVLIFHKVYTMRWSGFDICGKGNFSVQNVTCT